MKKIVRLTESDLTRIIKRVINENMSNNDLYKEITEILWNSNASNEEQISVLKYILNQKEGKGWVTKDKTNPLFTGDLSGLGKLVKRTYRIGMDEDFDINEGDGHSLKKLARRIMLTKFDEVLSEMNSDDFGDEFGWDKNTTKTYQAIKKNTDKLLRVFGVDVLEKLENIIYA